MSKMDSLKQAIDNIKANKDWHDVGTSLESYLDAGNMSGMKDFMRGVAKVVLIKGCPRKVRENLLEVFKILT